MTEIISINGNNNNSLVWLCLGSAPTLVNKTGTITNNFVWLKMGKWETKYSRETFKVNSPVYSWIFEKNLPPGWCTQRYGGVKLPPRADCDHSWVERRK